MLLDADAVVLVVWRGSCGLWAVIIVRLCPSNVTEKRAACAWNWGSCVISLYREGIFDDF